MALSKSKQQEYKRLYQNERKRIRKLEKKLGQMGVAIEKTEIPRYNKGIRLKDIKSLQKITSQSLREKYTKREYYRDDFGIAEYRIRDKITGRIVDIIPITQKAVSEDYKLRKTHRKKQRIWALNFAENYTYTDTHEYSKTSEEYINEPEPKETTEPEPKEPVEPEPIVDTDYSWDWYDSDDEENEEETNDNYVTVDYPSEGKRVTIDTTTGEIVSEEEIPISEEPEDEYDIPDLRDYIEEKIEDLPDNLRNYISERLGRTPDLKYNENIASLLDEVAETLYYNGIYSSTNPSKISRIIRETTGKPLNSQESQQLNNIMRDIRWSEEGVNQRKEYEKYRYQQRKNRKQK